MVVSCVLDAGGTGIQRFGGGPHSKRFRCQASSGYRRYLQKLPRAGGNALVNQTGGSITLTADLSLTDPTLPGLGGAPILQLGDTRRMVIVAEVGMRSAPLIDAIWSAALTVMGGRVANAAAPVPRCPRDFV